jgi:hypothetical protein
VVHCGISTVSEVWSVEPYGHLVTCDFEMQAHGGGLTIDDGAHVSFLPGTGITISDTLIPSTIDVQGADLGVTFTSDVTWANPGSTPSPGDWDGLSVYTYASDSTIEGLTVEYADSAGIHGFSDNVSIANSVVQYSAGTGIRNEYYQITIEDSIVGDNVGDGVFLDGSSNARPVVLDRHRLHVGWQLLHWKN